MQLQGRADVAVTDLIENRRHMRVKVVVPGTIGASVSAAEPERRSHRSIVNIGRGCVAPGMHDGSKEVRLHLRATGHRWPHGVEDLASIGEFTKVSQGTDGDAGTRLRAIKGGTRRFVRHS